MLFLPYLFTKIYRKYASAAKSTDRGLLRYSKLWHIARLLTNRARVQPSWILIITTRFSMRLLPSPSRFFYNSLAFRVAVVTGVHPLPPPLPVHALKVYHTFSSALL